MAECQIVTKVVTGIHSLTMLRTYRKERILIICDRFLRDKGTIARVTEELDPSNTVSLFADTVPDPTLEVIASGVTMAAGMQPTILIGFGGGAAIDTAKGIIYFSVFGKVVTQKPFFIAIPTTSGTGSEMTAFAVLTDTQTRRKLPVIDDTLYPDLAILDPHLVLSVPPSVTANTGFDVITHAIEAYVSVSASNFTDGVACKSFELALRSLPVCYHDGENIAARKTMLSASNMAGMAFNLSGLGMAHSMAHTLGGIFHVPHGLACAMFLPASITYNSCLSEVKAKYADLAYKVGIAPRSLSHDGAIAALRAVLLALMDNMEMPGHISALPEPIPQQKYEEEISLMAQNALQDRCLPENPVLLTYAAAVRIFHEIYE